jgi:hypothetical protein
LPNRRWLSIPRQPSELDDGLLTASEVAQLKLNADWVVLSACNTIAGNKPGAEALSGLARSFFYAGARALLVTRWSVASKAATRLTTSTFDLLKATPGIGRAEALREAMLAYLDDASSPQNAYPGHLGPGRRGRGVAPIVRRNRSPTSSQCRVAADCRVWKAPARPGGHVGRACVAANTLATSTTRGINQIMQDRLGNTGVDQ